MVGGGPVLRSRATRARAVSWGRRSPSGVTGTRAPPTRVPAGRAPPARALLSSWFACSSPVRRLRRLGCRPARRLCRGATAACRTGVSSTCPGHLYLLLFDSHPLGASRTLESRTFFTRYPILRTMRTINRRPREKLTQAHAPAATDEAAPAVAAWVGTGHASCRDRRHRKRRDERARVGRGRADNRGDRHGGAAASGSRVRATTFEAADIAASDLVPLLRGADAVVHLAWVIRPRPDRVDHAPDSRVELLTDSRDRVVPPATERRSKQFPAASSRTSEPCSDRAVRRSDEERPDSKRSSKAGSWQGRGPGNGLPPVTAPAKTASELQKSPALAGLLYHRGARCATIEEIEARSGLLWWRAT